jgi:hypothetical protein
MRLEAVFATLGMFLNLFIVDGVGVAVLANEGLAEVAFDFLGAGLLANGAHPWYVVTHLSNLY